MPAEASKVNMQVTYTKTRRHGWCLRIAHGWEPMPKLGSTIEVTTKAGEIKHEFVGQRIWTDGQVSLCRIARDPSKPVQLKKLDYIEPAWANDGPNVRGKRRLKARIIRIPAPK